MWRPNLTLKLAGIFEDLEHLYDFQTISYGGHFVFQNEAKIFQIVRPWLPTSCFHIPNM